MKVTVDFKAAFPQLEANSDEKTLNTTQNKIRPGENTVVVFIYDKGLLLSLFLMKNSKVQFINTKWGGSNLPNANICQNYVLMAAGAPAYMLKNSNINLELSFPRIISNLSKSYKIGERKIGQIFSRARGCGQNRN